MTNFFSWLLAIIKFLIFLPIIVFFALLFWIIVPVPKEKSDAKDDHYYE